MLFFLGRFIKRQGLEVRFFQKISQFLSLFSVVEVVQDWSLSS